MSTGWEQYIKDKCESQPEYFSLGVKNFLDLKKYIIIKKKNLGYARLDQESITCK